MGSDGTFDYSIDGIASTATVVQLWRQRRYEESTRDIGGGDTRYTNSRQERYWLTWSHEGVRTTMQWDTFVFAVTEYATVSELMRSFVEQVEYEIPSTYRYTVESTKPWEDAANKLTEPVSGGSLTIISSTWDANATSVSLDISEDYMRPGLPPARSVPDGSYISTVDSLRKPTPIPFLMTRFLHRVEAGVLDAPEFVINPATPAARAVPADWQIDIGAGLQAIPNLKTMGAPLSTPPTVGAFTTVSSSDPAVNDETSSVVVSGPNSDITTTREGGLYLFGVDVWSSATLTSALTAAGTEAVTADDQPPSTVPTGIRGFFGLTPPPIWLNVANPTTGNPLQFYVGGALPQVGTVYKQGRDPRSSDYSLNAADDIFYGENRLYLNRSWYSGGNVAREYAQWQETVD